MRIPLARWVAPFGDPGINDCSHLPRAFRSVPRPSSPLSAKASTRCPSFALHRATPNGKNHRETRRCSRNAVGRTMPRALDPGPTTGPPFGASCDAPAGPAKHRFAGAILLSRRNTCPAVEDTHRDPPRTRPLGPGRRKDPASVTQLAYSHLSINNAPTGIPIRGHAGGNFCLRAAYRVQVRGSPAGLSAKPRFACRPRPIPGSSPGSVRPVVEVNGFEPMTSCLQSRRSPS